MATTSVVEGADKETRLPSVKLRKTFDLTKAADAHSHFTLMAARRMSM